MQTPSTRSACATCCCWSTFRPTARWRWWRNPPVDIVFAARKSNWETEAVTALRDCFVNPPRKTAARTAR